MSQVDDVNKEGSDNEMGEHTAKKESDSAENDNVEDDSNQDGDMANVSAHDFESCKIVDTVINIFLMLLASQVDDDSTDGSDNEIGEHSTENERDSAENDDVEDESIQEGDMANVSAHDV